MMICMRVCVCACVRACACTCACVHVRRCISRVCQVVAIGGALRVKTSLLRVCVRVRATT
jgi:hypothetical protein